MLGLPTGSAVICSASVKGVRGSLAQAPSETAHSDPGFEVVPNQVEAIAAQSFTTMNRVGVKAVLAQTYSVANREGLSFHLSYVDRDHPDSGGTGFETDAMRRLYDYGYEKARSGSFWVTKLSQIEAAKEAATTTEH
jgi:hypothetical protein